MQDSQFTADQATNGLVQALFLAAAVFLVILLVQVLRDIQSRQSAPPENASARVLQVEARPTPTYANAAFVPS